MKLKNMEALRIEILNPKVKTILKQLADLDLIAISKMESPETELKNLLKKFRSKSKEAPTMDEITREVEVVRAERYARGKRKKQSPANANSKQVSTFFDQYNID